LAQKAQILKLRASPTGIRRKNGMPGDAVNPFLLHRDFQGRGASPKEGREARVIRRNSGALQGTCSRCGGSSGRLLVRLESPFDDGNIRDFPRPSASIPIPESVACGDENE
jgi:hypothetical protein